MVFVSVESSCGETKQIYIAIYSCNMNPSQ